MGISNLVAASGGGIKSVQRGLAVAAGTVSITSVNITKSFVTVFGTASSGSAPISGNINATNGSVSSFSGNGTANAANVLTGNNGTSGNQLTSFPGQAGSTVTENGFSASIGYNTANIALNAANISSGTTNLITAVVQGYLSSSTTLEVSGPCRWEVVEFN